MRKEKKLRAVKVSAHRKKTGGSDFTVGRQHRSTKMGETELSLKFCLQTQTKLHNSFKIIMFPFQFERNNIGSPNKVL